jgi:drug/metabolite transporter (DMT)-like permease
LHLGEFLALLTAFVWAIAVIFFKKSSDSVHPISLNIFKNILAIVCFIPTIYLLKQSLFYDAPLRDYLLLFLSGIVGIAIADTLFLKSLQLLGAGLYAIVDCLYAPFVVILSLLFLQEKLTWGQFIGVFLIVCSVLFISNLKNFSKSKRELWIGIFCGASAMAFTAIGVVIAKPILERSPLLWTTTIRLISGTLFLLVVLTFHSNRKAILDTLWQAQNWKATILGSFFGTYLSMLIWLAGMKLTQASIAAPLNQTTNVFVFIFAAIFLKEPLERTKIIAIVLAITGAFIMIASP